MCPFPFPSETPELHSRVLSDPDRLNALEGTTLMDSLPEEAFDRSVRIATQVLGVPVSLLSLVDTERQYFKAMSGLTGPAADARQTPLTHSLCQYVVTTEKTLAIDDTRTHPLLKNNGAVEDLHVIAYAGVPVHAEDGQVLGSFCAIDTKPRDWTKGQIQTLRDIAAMVESEIALREEIQVRQLLLREMHHRVKNTFAITAGMIGLTARSCKTTSEMAEALRGRVTALARAHDMVLPAMTDDYVGKTQVSLQALVVTLLEPHLHRNDDHLMIEGPTQNLGASGATNLAMVLHEFATNAAKYGALSVPDGTLSVTWQVVNGELVLTWDESGLEGLQGPPPQRGFGTQMVNMTVRGHFRGEIVTDWTATGVHHRLTMALSRLES